MCALLRQMKIYLDQRFHGHVSRVKMHSGNFHFLISRSINALIITIDLGSFM